GLLLPEADDHALLVVDQRGLVVVVPAVEAVHLYADGPVADLVATDRHEVLVGGVHPAVRRVDRVVLGHDPTVNDAHGLAGHLEPGLPELLELGAGVVDVHSSSSERAIAGQYLIAAVTSARRDSSGFGSSTTTFSSSSVRPKTVGASNWHIWCAWQRSRSA